jgi:hypothetical protein
MRKQALTQQLGFLPGEALRLEHSDRTTRKDNGESVRQQQGQSQLQPMQPSFIEGCNLTLSLRNSTSARYLATDSRAGETSAPVQ